MNQLSWNSAKEDYNPELFETTDRAKLKEGWESHLNKLNNLGESGQLISLGIKLNFLTFVILKMLSKTWWIKMFCLLL